MTVLDVFLYDGERDMLDCRMRELDGIVDLHVAIEADVTISGERRERTARSTRKLKVIQVSLADLTDVPEQIGPWVKSGMAERWQRDYKQRNGATAFLADFPDAVVISGDVDEIPTAQAVDDGLRYVVFSGEPVVVRMNMLVFSLRYFVPGGLWPGSVIAPASLTDLGSLRRSRTGLPEVRGGWHLTWFGGEEAIRRKAQRIAHGELEQYAAVGDPTQENLSALIDAEFGGYGSVTQWHGSVPLMAAEGLVPASWSAVFRGE
jgi:hypothetical protein